MILSTQNRGRGRSWSLELIHNEMLLECYGHEITLARNADEAVLASGSGMPDVFLIDIGLPGMDGRALASELRTLPCDKPPRMIAVTGFGQPEDRQPSLAAGFDESSG
ncbi:response regulator [Paraburkholderia hospita]|uniref:response regulator n=1 Tax=Paraburkholderia hospita TaxID=169430 RepID=UPI000B3455EB|nr:response regulator [Paraburkholderia hospita]OUL90549.1 hypothetical protein CA601_15335 [Paraburkholderia hospita]OUL96500.1 hypothetical protein CA603_05140 [Paraburkholderia hospita]